MSTAPSDFQDVAAELIGPSGEFAPFRKPCAITVSGAFDRSTQSAIQSVQTVQMIDVSRISSQFENKAVPACDIELVGLYSEFSTIPKIENTRFSFAGKSFALVDVEVDPAQATVTLRGSV